MDPQTPLEYQSQLGEPPKRHDTLGGGDIGCIVAVIIVILGLVGAIVGFFWMIGRISP